MSKPITAILLGAGQRGAEIYGQYALDNPDSLNFIAVVEPDPVRRRKFADDHAILEQHQYNSYEVALREPKMADTLFNCTPDQVHFDSGISALGSGYDVLLEKPVATRLSDTVKLVQAAEDQQRLLLVSHVLRYTEFFQMVHQFVHSGRLGQLITISHQENVSSWHMAHSYVRGSWRSESTSSPMILAKSCHDLDLIYWIVGSRIMKLSSFGALTHFKLENAPPGAPKRCTDGCPVQETCPFYAPMLYLDLQPMKHALGYARNHKIRFGGWVALKSPSLTDFIANFVPPLRELTDYSGWPRSAISNDPANKESLLHALETGPYGRCVYHCDNDVVDHQVVSLEFENGVTGTFTMHGHSNEEGRTLRIDGSSATLLGKFGFNNVYLELRDHRDNACQRFDFPNQVESRGHGGGDNKLVEKFIKSIRGENKGMTGARESLESHLMAFAAEKSRSEGTIIDMQVFRQHAELL